jgi:peptide/nickel transport system substrate-binding protein
VLDQSVTEDPAARLGIIEAVQTKVAADLPVLPLFQGLQVAVVGEQVDGMTLDASSKVRFAPLAKD